MNLWFYYTAYTILFLNLYEVPVSSIMYLLFQRKYFFYELLEWGTASHLENVLYCELYDVSAMICGRVDYFCGRVTVERARRRVRCTVRYGTIRYGTVRYSTARRLRVRSLQLAVRGGEPPVFILLLFKLW